MAVTNNTISGMNLAPRQAVSRVVQMAKSPKILERFKEVLNEKAPQFLASVVSAVNSNSKLLEAEPESVMACAMQAATLGLDVIPGLGFAALIPFNDTKNRKKTCQFQIMTRGYVQLALRTGQYAQMNVTEIYADELEYYDPITGNVQLAKVVDGDRDNDRRDKICGYAAYFKLTNGYEHIEYWTKARCLAHGKRYSFTFQKYNSGLWVDDFDAMAKKTVLKEALRKWGMLSTEMQKAVVADQKTFTSVDDTEGQYEDAMDIDSTPSDEEALKQAPLAKAVETPVQPKEATQEPEFESPAGPEAFDDEEFDF